MGSMSTFLRTPFSKHGLKCINFYEGILTKYIHNSNNHHYLLQQLQLNKTFIYNRRHLLSLNKIPILHEDPQTLKTVLFLKFLLIRVLVKNPFVWAINVIESITFFSHRYN